MLQIPGDKLSPVGMVGRKKGGKSLIFLGY